MTEISLHVTKLNGPMWADQYHLAWLSPELAQVQRLQDNFQSPDRLDSLVNHLRHDKVTQYELINLPKNMNSFIQWASITPSYRSIRLVREMSQIYAEDWDNQITAADPRTSGYRLYLPLAEKEFKDLQEALRAQWIRGEE